MHSETGMILNREGRRMSEHVRNEVRRAAARLDVLRSTIIDKFPQPIAPNSPVVEVIDWRFDDRRANNDPTYEADWARDDETAAESIEVEQEAGATRIEEPAEDPTDGAPASPSVLVLAADEAKMLGNLLSQLHAHATEDASGVWEQRVTDLVKKVHRRLDVAADFAVELCETDGPTLYTTVPGMEEFHPVVFKVNTAGAREIEGVTNFAKSPTIWSRVGEYRRQLASRVDQIVQHEATRLTRIAKTGGATVAALADTIRNLQALQRTARAATMHWS